MPAKRKDAIPVMPAPVDMGADEVIRASVIVDGLRKREVRYHLPAPATLALLDRFPEYELTVQDRSRRVHGARDQFTLQRGHEIRIVGALGRRELVVTFTREGMNLTDREELERRLERGGFGRVEQGCAAGKIVS